MARFDKNMYCHNTMREKAFPHFTTEESDVPKRFYDLPKATQSVICEAGIIQSQAAFLCTQGIFTEY